MDGQTDIMKLIVAFCNFLNAPKIITFRFDCVLLWNIHCHLVQVSSSLLSIGRCLLSVWFGIGFGALTVGAARMCIFVLSHCYPISMLELEDCLTDVYEVADCGVSVKFVSAIQF